MQWPDGRTYVGHWKSDKRHGKGVYTWPDGDTFEGEFVEGRRVGKGILRLATGEEYEQYWEEVFLDSSSGLILFRTNLKSSRRFQNQKIQKCIIRESVLCLVHQMLILNCRWM